MAISAKDVKRLRDTTGVGMMDCKRALEETGGDFEAAIELLRKKGQKVAAKRADREAKEGVIVARSSDDGKTSILVEVNCETDFVARNEDFQAFAGEIADLALANLPSDVSELLKLKLNDGRTVEQAVADTTGKIGEKIDVRRIAVVTSAAGKAVPYIHPGSRLGVVVNIEGDGEATTVGRDVAMQVAALNPVATKRDEVPEDVKQKEMEIARDAARNEGKPEQILDRIAQGKLERYFKDNVLVEQQCVMDSSMSVGDLLKETGLDVNGFVRFALGD
ncbi:MAG: translation elongation factor Ts [Rhodothermales bacterium]|nr:translation elongation factor Ts [Rhodothermales bacterium]